MSLREKMPATSAFASSQAHSSQPLLDLDHDEEENPEDDLEVDLARAALETGNAAFEAKEWDEATALFQEVLHALEQLPTQQRSFCDVLGLRYRLAVCVYNTRDGAEVENALVNVIEQPVSASKHKEHVHDAAHLLASHYIQANRIDDARATCERALQGRRRLLGKHHDASLESTALMAHIYVLLHNRARAKACLAMIPEVRREDVQGRVEASPKMKLRPMDSRSTLSHSTSEEPKVPHASPTELDSGQLMDNRCYGPVSSSFSEPSNTPRHPYPSHRRSWSSGSGLESLSSLTVASNSHQEYGEQSASTERIQTQEKCSIDDEVQSLDAIAKGDMSRRQILNNLRCAPVDRVEEAVCDADYEALASIIKKKKGGFLRSKMQKALHSKRVTALHFAALFGELDMARLLLDAGFDINEVPELSTSRLTPLKFAIGGRQADMVEFLVAKGAKPIEPDSWATLAGQLMDRSWLANTMSMVERVSLDEGPRRMIAILKIWLKHGWNVDSPYDTFGRTLLHQAVAVETGSYKWDANLRVTMTRFLCEQGAAPSRSDAKGNTPLDMAAYVNDQALLFILNQRQLGSGSRVPVADPVELPASASSPVELIGSTTPAKHSSFSMMPPRHSRDYR